MNYAGKKRSVPLTIALLLMLAAASGILLWRHAYAAAPAPEQIRVALFINLGKKYKVTVPTVTLSSPAGFAIGASEESVWLNTGNGKAVRGSADLYMVRLLETGDASAARSLYKQLKDKNAVPYLFKRTRQGKPVYQVYAGQFAGKDEAEQAKQKWAADGSLAPLFTPAKVAVTGPLHWNAGTYGSEKEAVERLANLESAGLNPFLVYGKSKEGAPLYSVWIGEAADEESLNQAKAQAMKLSPGITLKPIDAREPYLLLRNDASLDETNKDAVSHYFFNASSGQKVRITAKQGEIKVEERFGRSYRGAIELSVLNGSLAVVNVLPLEQYLYSVVGSELPKSWPPEAMKAQAVAARTYALAQGMKYEIAHVSDTTYDQVYYGKEGENDAAIQAVEETKGEVITTGAGALITPFYYSNAGGMTADPVEVRGKTIDYLKSTPSPDDVAQQGKLTWHQALFPDGSVGYIRSDYVKETGEKTSTGLPYMEVVQDGVNVRPAPYVDNSANVPLKQAAAGERFVSLGQTIESNAYNWVRGPYDAEQLRTAMNAKLASPVTGSLNTLEITARGPSGRVTEMKANGQVIRVSEPDAYRSLFNGLPSTRFDIEEMGRYTILGAHDAVRHFPEQKGPLYVLSGRSSGAPAQSDAVAMGADRAGFLLIGGENKLRLVTREPQFRFIGFGFGHGMGMSQWGAKGLAEAGYDYQSILKYYYKDVSIVKE